MFYVLTKYVLCHYVLKSCICLFIFVFLSTIRDIYIVHIGLESKTGSVSKYNMALYVWNIIAGDGSKFGCRGL